ncbi:MULTISPECIES: DUF3159 domain-containing protein [unclassified Micromonospora]|uniref:DUF3159 domain-containing protein n=1 Tax=unclassified Micromonospora TaxID=2617518 RepID=UPI000EF452EB|nr:MULTISPECIES: DUF3159 domain-containing protein [unclassified Micromonospora]RLP88080.1 DUF3159 domain-containing protein [Micromonospora sp. BL4]RLP88089.1 DUF3159 domain-containing protein [Micromonospora sp. BL4]RLP91452.1 DUF3159 domain-containing protein [Micromonospora sp. CV4]
MTTGQHRAAQPETGPEDDERLPTIAEQMADQLGGWRGLVESSIPVVVFVVANIIGELRPAVIASVAVALLIAGLRLAQRRPIRHAVNGLFGVGIGAAIAWRTGDERDFYLPGILYGIGYGIALLVSAAIRQPLVGWIWSVLVAKGRAEWRDDPKLVRTFTQLTVLWGVVWLAKVGVQAGLYLAHQDTALGVARLALGYPPYALLLLITVWTVRRVTREPQPTPLPGA